MQPLLRLLLAALLGVAAAALLACGSSGNGLIPASAAGPLQSDFETVAQAAQSGEGSCTATEAALTKTDQDYAALPSTIDAGLRNTLRQGISNLRSRALALCAQPLAQSTVTNTTPKTTPSTTTATTTTTPPTTTTTTPPSTNTTTTTTPAEPGPGGGTPAPGAGESESESGQGAAQGGATPGGGSPSGGVGAGGGQEGAGK
jgi:cytoskeletal protein RodZ